MLATRCRSQFSAVTLNRKMKSVSRAERRCEPRSELMRDDLRLNRHCERSEAIHRAVWTEWIASSLSLLAMTAKLVIEPEIIVL